MGLQYLCKKGKTIVFVRNIALLGFIKGTEACAGFLPHQSLIAEVGTSDRIPILR
jgi:hypothetical protein